LTINSSDIPNVIRKHKSHGIFIDSNLLLLFTIGSYNLELIKKFKRTSKFNRGDFQDICWIVNYFDKIITTPHILTEVSNLSNQLQDKCKDIYFNVFFEKLKILEEKNIPLRKAMEDTKIRKYGLSDAVIHTIANDKYLIITDDFPLSSILLSKGVDVINFNHLSYLSFLNSLHKRNRN